MITVMITCRKSSTNSLDHWANALHLPWLHSSDTLTEVFPCFFLSCKANAGLKLAKVGHGPHSSKLVVICVVLLLFLLFYVLFVFVLFFVLFVCKCVLYYCHWVLTQLQLTNISYHIYLYWSSRRRNILYYFTLFHNFCFWKTTKSALTVEEFWIMFLILKFSHITESIRKVYTVSDWEVLYNLIHYTARRGESFCISGHKTQITGVYVCIDLFEASIWMVYNGLHFQQFWYLVVMGLI